MLVRDKGAFGFAHLLGPARRRKFNSMSSVFHRSIGQHCVICGQPAQAALVACLVRHCRRSPSSSGGTHAESGRNGAGGRRAGVTEGTAVPAAPASRQKLVGVVVMLPPVA